MAVSYPPDNYHGKALKMWYRHKTKELTDIAFLPEGWQHRVGLEMRTQTILVLIPNPTAYEHWDMRNELVNKWKFSLHA